MRDALRTNVLTGLVVLLPISLFVLVIVWLYQFLNALIAPLGDFYGLPRIAIVIIVILFVLLILFLVGLASRTRIGAWFFTKLEKYVFSRIPGYNLVRRILEPFIGNNLKNNFKSVALVDIWDNGTLMTAFITDRHESHTTVFVPTGPNPMNGNIYHVPNKRVHSVDAKVDQVLSSVISVGAGSKKLIDKLNKK